MNLLLPALLILCTGVPFVAVLVVVPRRLLGLQIGVVRAVIVAIVGYAVLFAVGLVWRPSRADYTPALVTDQIGLPLFVAMAFLAVAEAVVPSGSGLRVVNWRRSWHRKLGRSRRYGEIFAIALRHASRSSWSATAVRRTARAARNCCSAAETSAAAGLATAR